MRRQASRSIWPYLGLLVCLLIMSLAAPHSWYVGGRGKPGRDGRRPAGARVTSVRGPLLDVPQPTVGRGAGERPLFAERFTSFIDVLDDISISRLLPVPPPVPSFLPEIENWSLPLFGARRANQVPSTAKSREPSVASTGTFSSPAGLRDRSDVRVRDERDRLAVRLRVLARLGARGREENAQVVAKPEPPAATTDAAWLQVEPTSLLDRLEALAEAPTPQLAAWAEAARAEVEQVYRPASAEQAAIAERLAILSDRADAAKSLEPQLPLEERNDLQLARAALIRRLAVWNASLAIADEAPLRHSAGDEFVRAAGEAKAALAVAPQGLDWAEYLLLDELTDKWQAGPERSDKHLRHLIEQLADRFESRRLSAAQRALLAREPFGSLRARFGHWAAAAVDLTILCKAIEAQEARGGEVYARRIAADARLLALASDPAVRHVASAVDRHYRGSNLRVAVGRAFLQRLIPRQPSVLEPVRETIAGAAIAGRSLTETDVRVLLIPDSRLWRVGLEVTGNVASQTAITSGPATFHSAARTDYVARKLIVLSPVGLHSFPAVAGAAANSMLHGLDTSFDGIPIVEGLVRSIVIGQHDSNQEQVLTAVESRVSRTARQRLDTQLDRRLSQAAGQMQRSMWAPLVDLGLRPEELALETTAERLTGTCRLAAQRQLAADSPRPYALADSVLSMQMHESVINNLLERLDLSDREFKLPELYEHIAAQLGRDVVAVPEELSPTACIRFARLDPIAVSVEDGRVRISLSLDSVQEKRSRFCDFRVHAFYRPQVDGLHAQLVRDGIIEIEGSSLRPSHHAILQGVFVSLFSESRPLTVIPADRNNDPRLAGLMITQLVLEEGWLGVAIGPGHPRRTAVMTRIVR